MGRTNFNKRIIIPKSKQFPKLINPSYKAQIVEKKENFDESVLKNETIDKKRLALLVNICHVVADVNEQLSVEISEILSKADPNLQLQFQRSIRQIRNHSSDMVRFVDTHTSENFAVGFGETADAMKAVIMNFFRDKG